MNVKGARSEYATAGFSGISVNPLIPPTTENPSVISVPGLSTGQMVGVVMAAVIAALIIILIVIVMLWYVNLMISSV